MSGFEAHQALLNLLHMERHMIGGGIGLRQLIDWAVFVSESSNEHWSKYTIAMLKNCGLWAYAQALTKTCVMYLGLSAEKAPWCLEIKDNLANELMQDIFRGGNMGTAEDDGMNGLFTNRSILGEKQQGALHALIETLNRRSYQNYAITRRHKWLLPLFWVYLPLRYTFRVALGRKSAKKMINAVSTSNDRYKLYKQLHLYEVK